MYNATATKNVMAGIKNNSNQCVTFKMYNVTH